MIAGIGVDLVDIARIRQTLAKYGEHFERKYFSAEEIAYCRGKPDPGKHFAARFAVKEAVLKCLGLGIGRGIAMKDIEVTHDPAGRPACRLTGKGEERFRQLALVAIHISISHEKNYAVAEAVAEQ